MNESERCEKCRHFKRFYVPPLTIHEGIPKDGYCCDAIGCEGQVMYLGDIFQVKNGFCEMFSWKGVAE